MALPPGGPGMVLACCRRSPGPPAAALCSERRGLLRGGRMAVVWDGRAAFAELGLSIAVSF
eukprot:694801-Hanusia_phi.AAC.1